MLEYLYINIFINVSFVFQSRDPATEGEGHVCVREHMCLRVRVCGWTLMPVRVQLSHGVCQDVSQPSILQWAVRRSHLRVLIG